MLKNFQICVVPDPKIFSLDLMPRVEFLENDYRERKKRVVSINEAEEKIVRLNSIDFHQALTTMQVKRIKNTKIG